MTPEMLERRRAAEAEAGANHFREIADAIPGLVFETDRDGDNTYVNQQYRAYTGLSMEALLGDGWRQVVHPDDRESAVKAFVTALHDGEPFEREIRIRRADGSCRWFMLRLSVFRDPQGHAERGIGVLTDIDDAKRAETAMRELQNTLMQEVSHRVKNSLALVSSVLSVQARTLEGAARRSLEEAALRVHAVARVHDQLWRRAVASDIDLHPFLCDLCSAVGGTAPQYTTACQAEPAIISADVAVPLGLFINELLTNAYKYAYPEGVSGEVKVLGRRVDDNLYELEVTDAGRGLPPDFDLDKARESLGIRVITNLAAQLNGQLTAGSADPGARFTLVFPLKPA